MSKASVRTLKDIREVGTWGGHGCRGWCRGLEYWQVCAKWAPVEH